VVTPPATGNFQHSLPDLLRGEYGPGGLHEGFDVHTLPLGVGRHRLGAQIGGRGQLRENRHEADPQPGQLRFGGGVAADDLTVALAPA